MTEMTFLPPRAALKIEQPLGTFYAFSLDAITLNKITYSQPAEVVKRLEAESSDGKGYSIFGSQRREAPNRLKEIAKFIQSEDATFPNAIILAANYDDQGNLLEDDRLRWSVQSNGDEFSITIPVGDIRTASIIDGQHRLRAFQQLEDDAPNRNMELLCVVFLELPTPYHAYVFATINFNQKRVDRSLAYDLFGFDVDERPPKLWPPETLAVYLTRVLNTDKKSPLYRCIVPAADSKVLFGEIGENGGVRISMATIVDGILRLISKKPKDDRSVIRHANNIDKGRRALKADSSLPLRNLYLEGNDKAIFDLICNYFSAIKATIWRTSSPNSYLRKTIGVQALFDILLNLLRKRSLDGKSFSVEVLTELFRPCEVLDTDGTRYQSSGIGKSQIRNDIIGLLGL